MQQGYVVEKTGNEAYKISKCQNILLLLEFSWHHGSYFSHFIWINWSKFIEFCTSVILEHKILELGQKRIGSLAPKKVKLTRLDLS